jgi:N-dimethylarginine dimethylaminohydrolase
MQLHNRFVGAPPSGLRVLGREIHRAGGAPARAMVRERGAGNFYTYAFDPHFLHLDVQMGMLAEGLAVVCAEAVEPELLMWLKSKRIRVLEIPYADAMRLGTNVVALGNERVLVPASSKNLIAACRAEGLTVYDPDVAMIGNGGGASTACRQALTRDRVGR